MIGLCFRSLLFIKTDVPLDDSMEGGDRSSSSSNSSSSRIDVPYFAAGILANLVTSPSWRSLNGLPCKIEINRAMVRSMRWSVMMILFVGGSSNVMASSHIRNGCLSVCIVHFHLIYQMTCSVHSVPSLIFSLDRIVRVLNYGQFGQWNMCASEELLKLMETI